MFYHHLHVRKETCSTFDTTGTFICSLPKFKVFLLGIRLGKNNIISVRFTGERRKLQPVHKLCFEEEFAGRVDSTNHDGGWCEFSTTFKGNYQYFSVVEGTPFLNVCSVP